MRQRLFLYRVGTKPVAFRIEFSLTVFRDQKHAFCETKMADGLSADKTKVQILGGRNQMKVENDVLGLTDDQHCRSILFVCWGNVCRSPAAAIILKRELKRLGVDDLQIQSAGISPDYRTTSPSWSMLWASFCRGIWLRTTPRMFTKRDFSQYDLVVAMDREVLLQIKAIARGEPKNVRMLSAFLPEDSPIDVPDPMNRSIPVCNRVLDMLELACCALCRYMNPRMENSMPA